MAAAMLETIPVVEPIPAETSLRVFRRMLAAYYVEERLMAVAKQESARSWHRRAAMRRRRSASPNCCVPVTIGSSRLPVPRHRDRFGYAAG